MGNQFLINVFIHSHLTAPLVVPATVTQSVYSDPQTFPPPPTSGLYFEFSAN